MTNSSDVPVPDNQEATETKEMRENELNEEGNLNPEVLIFQPKRITAVKIKIK